MVLKIQLVTSHWPPVGLLLCPFWFDSSFPINQNNYTVTMIKKKTAKPNIYNRKEKKNILGQNMNSAINNSMMFIYSFNQSINCLFVTFSGREIPFFTSKWFMTFCFVALMSKQLLNKNVKCLLNQLMHVSFP